MIVLFHTYIIMFITTMRDPKKSIFYKEYYNENKHSW
jgi:hypothetical protein